MSAPELHSRIAGIQNQKVESLAAPCKRLAGMADRDLARVTTIGVAWWADEARASHAANRDGSVSRERHTD